MGIETITRSWLSELLNGERLGRSCPAPWASWVRSGRYAPLIATPVERIPRKNEQLPATADGMGMLHAVYEHFSGAPFKFERFAGELFRLHRSGFVGTIDYTCPYRDGGRDTVGEMIAGIGDETVIGEFAIEAKCYAPSCAIGTKEVSRLSGRLRDQCLEYSSRPAISGAKRTKKCGCTTVAPSCS